MPQYIHDLVDDLLDAALVFDEKPWKLYRVVAEIAEHVAPDGEADEIASSMDRAAQKSHGQPQDPP